MPWTREEKIFCVTTYSETKSFKTVSKYKLPINMIMIYYQDKKLEIRLRILEVDIKAIKKHSFDVSGPNDAFLQDVSRMTAIGLVSVINHYHINGLHLFWDTGDSNSMFKGFLFFFILGKYLVHELGYLPSTLEICSLQCIFLVYNWVASLL